MGWKGPHVPAPLSSCPLHPRKPQNTPELGWLSGADPVQTTYWPWHMEVTQRAPGAHSRMQTPQASPCPGTAGPGLAALPGLPLLHQPQKPLQATARCHLLVMEPCPAPSPLPISLLLQAGSSSQGAAIAPLQDFTP